MGKQTNILLILLLFTLPLQVSGVNNMYSTSSMRDRGYSTYRSNYGSQHVGTDSYTGFVYSAKGLHTTSSSLRHTYGSAYTGAYQSIHSLGKTSNHVKQGMSIVGSIDGSNDAIAPVSRPVVGQSVTSIPRNQVESESAVVGMRSRFFAPPSGGKETQWANWWTAFAASGMELTEDNLRTWWYSIYGGSAAPDDYQDFYNWCKANRQFASLPLADGTAFLLVLGMLTAIVIHRRKLLSKHKLL